MGEASKKLAIKNQVETALDLRHENREIIKTLQTFDSSYFISKSYFDDGSQDYLIFQAIFKYFHSLLVLLIKFLDGSLKGYQKKISQLLLNQTIILLQNQLIFIARK